MKLDNQYVLPEQKKYNWHDCLQMLIMFFCAISTCKPVGSLQPLHTISFRNLSWVKLTIYQITYVQKATQWFCLIHCGLVTSYGNRCLGQHWLREWLVSWWHQAITWTNVDLSSVRSCGINLRAILKEIPRPPFTKISLKITYLKSNLNLPGANELIVSSPNIMITN